MGDVSSSMVDFPLLLHSSQSGWYPMAPSASAVFWSILGGFSTPQTAIYAVIMCSVLLSMCSTAVAICIASAAPKRGTPWASFKTPGEVGRTLQAQTNHDEWRWLFWSFSIRVMAEILHHFWSSGNSPHLGLIVKSPGISRLEVSPSRASWISVSVSWAFCRSLAGTSCVNLAIGCEQLRRRGPKKRLRVLCTKIRRTSRGSDTEHTVEDHDVRILSDMMVPIIATMTLLLLAMLRRIDSMMLMSLIEAAEADSRYYLNQVQNAVRTSGSWSLKAAKVIVRALLPTVTIFWPARWKRPGAQTFSAALQAGYPRSYPSSSWGKGPLSSALPSMEDSNAAHKQACSASLRKEQQPLTSMELQTCCTVLLRSRTSFEI